MYLVKHFAHSVQCLLACVACTCNCIHCELDGGSSRFLRNDRDLFVRHNMEQHLLSAKRPEHNFMISRIT